MASIALRNIRFIDYLAYGSIFTRVMFGPQKIVDVFPTRKAVDEPWELWGASSHTYLLETDRVLLYGTVMISAIFFYDLIFLLERII
jgi:hypothetical protein